MMLPRTLVPFHTLCSDKPTLEQTVHELQTELHQARSQLNDERLARAKVEAELAIVRKGRGTYIPEGDEDGYWCRNCQRQLSDEYTYCPECGCLLDWETEWIDPRYNYKHGTFEQDVKTIAAYGRATGQIHR